MENKDQNNKKWHDSNRIPWILAFTAPYIFIAICALVPHCIEYVEYNIGYCANSIFQEPCDPSKAITSRCIQREQFGITMFINHLKELIGK